MTIWSVYLQSGHTDLDSNMDLADEWVVTKNGEPYVGGFDTINEALHDITDSAVVGDHIKLDVVW